MLAAIHQHAQKLQNKPPQFIPQEDLPASEIVTYLKPYTIENGGPLLVKKYTYAQGRSNLIITYPGTGEKVLSFVGSHMDTVPADPEQWTKDPFTLERDAENPDKVYGRGTTDCLGHVAMLAVAFKELAILRPKLERTIIAVLIANEENADIGGVGIDELERRGELAQLKNGPLIWMDSADVGPTLGTGGVITWSLTAKGKLFHSGLPHKAINSIELCHEALKVIQTRFHQDYAFGDLERKYLYNVGSSMKPTQMTCAPGGLNQIPGWATISGDIRLTPFHDIKAMCKKVEQYVSEIDVSILPSIGFSKYTLPEENLKGVLEFSFLVEPHEGVAVNMDSEGYHALYNAIETVRGKAEPFSLTGSLPVIADLQKSGYDVQVCGFGKMSVYHGNDEYVILSDLVDGASVVFHMIAQLNSLSS